jgi:hypothetical protein
LDVKLAPRPEPVAIKSHKKKVLGRGKEEEEDEIALEKAQEAISRIRKGSYMCPNLNPYLLTFTL